MNYCESCRHWQADVIHDSPEGWRECRMGTPSLEALKVQRGVNKDLKMSSGVASIEYHPRSLVRATSPGKEASLITAPRFGCVHWDGAL